MAKARKLLKRAKAVRSIRTVTKTMEMVATARFKKSHDRAIGTRPFVDCLAETVKAISSADSADLSQYPLLRKNASVGCEVLLVITSNRGLAGPYNSSVLRLAMERARQLRAGGVEAMLYVVGKRGIQFMRFRRQKVQRSFTQFDKQPAYQDVAAIADELMDLYAAGKIGAVEVVYTQFASAGRQRAAVAGVLPLTELSSSVKPWVAQTSAARRVYEMIPSTHEILMKLLPLSVRMKIYQCFLDGAVSEQMMRVTAMRAATDSADDMLHTLTVRYNRTRQAQITTELAEIMGGAMGMES